MTHGDVASLFLALGILLAAARVLGELAVRFKQPSVLGELMAGIVLGPTLLGAFWPGLTAALFPETPGFTIALEGITLLGIALFLLVAGMEVDLSTIWRQGRPAIAVGVMGMAAPFAVGLAAVWLMPGLFEVRRGEGHFYVFMLFFATALSISALPVISKILMDINLFRSDMGMIIIAAAIFNDLVGWIIFALVLSMMDSGPGHDASMNLGATIFLVLAFTALVLTAGRWSVNRVLPWIQANTTWPAGVFGFALAGGLICAAFTEWIGVHAIFGAFLFGIALGDSRHLRESTRKTLEQFISFIFAPLFFASIGLRVDFVKNFDVLLVIVVLVLATVTKTVGCAASARWSGMPWRESWALGFGMNARGAMEIVLGLMALEAGVIGERMFVALVVMALVTSMTSGSMMQHLLKPQRARRFIDYLSSKAYYGRVKGTDQRSVLRELSQQAAAIANLDPERVFEMVWAREQAMSTSLNHGLAVPHARLPDLKFPVVVVGVSMPGVDFDAMDGRPTQLIFMILTPLEDYQIQLDILADIGQTFKSPEFVEKCLAASGHTEFMALIKSSDA